MNKAWVNLSLGEIGKIYSGNSINEKEKAKNFFGVKDGLPYISTKDISLNCAINYDNGVKIPEQFARDFRLAKKGSVLICAEGGSAGRKVGYLEQDTFFVNKLFCFEPYEKVNGRFIFYFFQSSYFKKQFLSHMSGLIGGVSSSKFKSIKVFLPSLFEQNQIVEKLDRSLCSASHAIINTRKSLENVSSLFKDVLDATFLENNGEWKPVVLENLLLNQPRNGWSPPSEFHASTGTPVLTLSSVTGFVFKEDEIKYTSAKVDRSRHYWVENGDFLITRSNTSDLVGHVAVVSGLREPTIYPDIIMKIKPNINKVITEFLYYQMQTSFMRKKITSLAHGANPTMKKITKGDVQSLPISIPSIDTQKSIIFKIHNLNEQTQKLSTLIEKKLFLLNELKQSLLQKAFRGELTSSADALAEVAA